MGRSWGLAVALAALAASASAEDEAPETLICAGTEPFWALTVDEDGAIFSTPDSEGFAYQIVDQRAAIGREWPKAVTLAAPEDTAVAILARAACSDTMSDQPHDWRIEMLTQWNGEAALLTGCCRAAPSE